MEEVRLHQDDLEDLSRPFNSYEIYDEIRLVMADDHAHESDNSTGSRRRLFDASEKGQVGRLEKLIKEEPDILNKEWVNSFGQTPLHISASQGHLELTEFLLDKRPDLAAQFDHFQRKPLHWAALKGYPEIAKALAQRNSGDCFVCDRNGLIPLHYAVIKGQIHVIKELIEAQPRSVWIKLGSSGETVLHICVKYNHFEALQLLTGLVIHDDVFLNSQDNGGNTILDWSLMLKQIQTIRYLLSLEIVKTGSKSVKKMDSSVFDIIEPHSRYSSISSETHTIQEVPRPMLKGAKNKNKITEKAGNKSRKWWTKWRRHMSKYDVNWLKEVQGTLMMVATVIASISFQAAMNPPGGVWQEDTRCNYSSTVQLRNCTAGTSVMASLDPYLYSQFLTENMVSFLASLSVILLLVSGFPLNNKVCVWLLTLAMCTAVTFLALTYIVAMDMLTDTTIISEYEVTYIMNRNAMYIWIGLLCAVGIHHTSRFTIWAVKKLRRVLKTK